MVVKVRSSFTAPVRGIGKPDYTREVSSSRQRAGLVLEYNQTVIPLVITNTDRVAHPYSEVTIKPVLAPGAEEHIIDSRTGLATPYSFPAGYFLTLVQWEWTNNEDIELWHYLDGLLLGCGAISPAGDNISFNVLAPYSSLYTDPTAASAHTYDVVIVNRGLGNLSGTVDFILILEPLGTQPLPTTKECMCPFCNHKQVVPGGTTHIICDECGKLYIVRDYSRIRKL